MNCFKPSHIAFLELFDMFMMLGMDLEPILPFSLELNGQLSCSHMDFLSQL
jgi:hypothetical protein